jgi:hypothetical protein
MGASGPAEVPGVVTIVADIDRPAAEALRIELTLLARRYGLEPQRVQIEKGHKGHETDSGRP